MDIFKGAFLDKIYLESLEKIAIHEGWITDWADPHVHGDESPLIMMKKRFHGIRNSLRRKTLILLTLYENIDSNHSLYDYSRFIDEGIVTLDAKMLDMFQHTSLPFTETSVELLMPDPNLERFCMNTSVTILSEFREQIVSLHIKRSPPGYYRIRKSQKTTDDKYSKMTLSEIYSKRHIGLLDKKHLLREFDKILPYLIEHNDVDTMWDLISKYIPVELHPFADDLLSIKRNLEECIFASIKQNVSFVTGISKNEIEKGLSAAKLIDDLYYLASTKLTDDILTLPEPNSIRDVVRLRKKSEIRSFREVLSNWCSAISDGDEVAEKIIRKDIKKASNAMKAVGKIHEYEKSPLNFWINTIGGHIPILSNILTVVNMVTRIYVAKMEKERNWIMLVQ